MPLTEKIVYYTVSLPPPSALTEKIVAVLPRMKCPHRLEPHQIQGLDFIHIYPVIQWLVKLAIATREEMGDYIRAFSESQFSKDHVTPDVSGCGLVGVACMYVWGLFVVGFGL